VSQQEVDAGRVKEADQRYVIDNHEKILGALLQSQTDLLRYLV